MTKDNLIKRNWKGSTKCCFYSLEESIQHLFFECHVARFVWNTQGHPGTNGAYTKVENEQRRILGGAPNHT